MNKNNIFLNKTKNNELFNFTILICNQEYFFKRKEKTQ